jgi:hypothetical protein
MDFHPLVTRPVHPGIKIPLYDNPRFKYDQRQPFSSYPPQKNLPNFVDDVFDLPITDTLSALQSWLFFGLMTEIFEAVGVVISCEDFILEEDGSKYVTAKPLRRYLWYCIGNIKNMLYDDVEGTAEYIDRSFGKRIDSGEIPNRINSAVSIANDIVNEILSRGPDVTSNPELGALLLSLMCLIETLGDSRLNWDIFPDNFKTVVWTPDPVPLLTDLLVNAGWCHQGINWLYNRCLYISMLYFVTFFNQRIQGRDHTECTLQVRTMDTINEDTYVTKHVGTCNCQPLGVEVASRIQEILEKGEIPLLSVSSSGSGTSLAAKSATDVVHFVAISHVWSDGLGNPHINSLPSCQLLRLQSLVNNLYPNTSEQRWFWIDTICVPLSRALRNLAIRRMASVYQSSEFVLVLDLALLSSTLNASKTEVLARIKSSSWAQRLWTFNEGILARRFRLVFQFQDAYFRMEQGFSRLVGDEAFITTANAIVSTVSQIEETDTKNRILRAIAYFRDTPEEFRSSIKRRFSDFPTSTDELISEWLWRCGATTGDILFMDGWTTYRELTENYGHGDISRIGQGLKNRKTSKPEDETICLGAVLGIDVQPMFNKSSQGRMKYLFQTVDKIRPAIIFYDGPRIDEDGFRWAPLSFLRPERHPREPGYHSRGMWAERHHLGLLVNFDGFLLSEPPLTNVFTIASGVEKYVVHLQPSVRQRQSGRMAIIHELRLSELNDTNFSTKAILVEFTNIQDGIQFTRFCTVGIVGRAGTCPAESIEIINTTNARWCVG